MGLLMVQWCIQDVSNLFGDGRENTMDHFSILYGSSSLPEVVGFHLALYFGNFS